MRSWVDPVNNFSSADTEGNIAYRTGWASPRPHPIANAWGPVPGWTDDHEWHGNVPYDEMPRVVNPATGLIVTANQRIVDDTYPHYLGLDYARPDRALRIHDRLDDATRCHGRRHGRGASGSPLPRSRCLGGQTHRPAGCGRSRA